MRVVYSQRWDACCVLTEVGYDVRTGHTGRIGKLLVLEQLTSSKLHGVL